MKKVIRSLVFETNSSSTHSFTIKRSDEEREDCTFVLKTPLAKAVWLYGLCENAESTYQLDLEAVLDGKNEDDVRLLLIDRAKKVLCENETMGYVTTEEDIENSLTLTLDGLLKVFDDGYNEFVEEAGVIDYLYHMSCRDEVVKIKRFVLEELASICKVSEQEALEMMCVEGARCYEMERLMEGYETFEQKVERLKQIDSYFQIIYEDAEDKEKVVNERLGIRDVHDCKECFCCDHYFQSSALDECYCGFTSYGEIYGELRNLYNGEDEDKSREVAKRLLSGSVYIEGHEKYCGVKKIITDDEY